MSVYLKRPVLCGRSMDECLRMIEGFHGWKAPGLVLGLFMVNLARELIGADTEADAIVETRHCLPDAVQLFTPCTVGNGWLKILDWDKFALTLFDRRALAGVRVWLDLAKTRQFPHLYSWFMRRVPKKELPLEVLLETILTAGDSVLSSRPVNVTRLYQRQKKGETTVCPRCGEAYAAKLGALCLACRGAGYYEPLTQGVRSVAVR
jgi:formylmethanofuran dehydrogenase subunit E